MKPPSPWEQDVDCKLEKWKLQQQLQRNKRCCCVVTAFNVVLWVVLGISLVLSVHFVFVFMKAKYRLDIEQHELETLKEICRLGNFHDKSRGEAELERHRRYCQQVLDKVSMNVRYEAAAIAFEDLLGHFVPPGLPCNDICRRFMENVVAWAGAIVVLSLVIIGLTMYYCVRPFWDYKHRLLQQLHDNSQLASQIEMQKEKERELMEHKKRMAAWIATVATQSSTLMDPNRYMLTSPSPDDPDDSSSDAVAEHA